MCIKKTISYFDKIFNYILNQIKQLYLLSCRGYIFWVFFISGWLKFENALNGNWYITENLFKYIYKVPILNYKLAAILATFNELFFSIFLIIGLMSKFSSLVLLFMTLIITLTYSQNNEQIIWSILLINVILFGPGKISIDHFIQKRKSK